VGGASFHVHAIADGIGFVHEQQGIAVLGAV